MFWACILEYLHNCQKMVQMRQVPEGIEQVRTWTIGDGRWPIWISRTYYNTPRKTSHCVSPSNQETSPFESSKKDRDSEQIWSCYRFSLISYEPWPPETNLAIHRALQVQPEQAKNLVRNLCYRLALFTRQKQRHGFVHVQKRNRWLCPWQAWKLEPASFVIAMQRLITCSGLIIQTTTTERSILSRLVACRVAWNRQMKSRKILMGSSQTDATDSDTHSS